MLQVWKQWENSSVRLFASHPKEGKRENKESKEQAHEDEKANKGEDKWINIEMDNLKAYKHNCKHT
jgi:hypothetical protein